MADPLVEAFSAAFAESDGRFPSDFLQTYELLECLSHSELGETFLAKHRLTRQYHVAKCYPAESPLGRDLDGELLKKLRHPGLPAFVKEYRNAEMRCLVREFVAGQSLDQLAREAPPARPQALAIAIQLCEILAYLHGQTPPIIHRDIKPQNIIVDERGKVTLIDFGISRLYDEVAQADTMSLGTRPYAPPEQYGFSQTDARSDIYSLGVVLRWLLTRREDVPQTSRMLTDPWLVRIVDKCTAFAPEDRYQHVGQVRTALAGRQGLHLPALAASGLALALLAGLLFGVPFAAKPSPAPARVVFREPLIEQAVQLALRKDASQPLFEQDLLSVDELRVFGDKAAGDEETFQVYADSFAHNGGTVVRGGIRSLEDLARLKNLRHLSLAYQNVDDLGPLAGLAELEWLDVRHNPLRDVTSLAQLPRLTHLLLFDTNVTDLTALRNCPRLAALDIGMTPITTTTALQGLETLEVLACRKSALSVLEHLDTFPRLEEIYLAETHVLDLSPLLAAPRLQKVEVDSKLRPAAEAIAGAARFTITYP